MDVSVLEEYVGKNAVEFLNQRVSLNSEDTEVLLVKDAFNIKAMDNTKKSIVNINKVNDIRNANDFFLSAHEKLEDNGLFIGCVETIHERRKRLRKKFIPVFNYIYIVFDFIFKRIFPKLPITRNIYFFITAGRNSSISLAEVLGRAAYCGFEIKEIKEINNLTYFVACKNRKPQTHRKVNTGMLLRLERLGNKGRKIKVYKFRTMHPYAEFIQDFMYEKNKLQEGGKFSNDFRITGWGRVMRKLWLDEFPMILNLILFQIKLVGVRPISQHYYDLYPENLKQKRLTVRPGLIPPFYMDLPKTFDEIVESELKYLESYKKKPLRTDFKYFFGAIKNIIFKGARSN